MKLIACSLLYLSAFSLLAQYEISGTATVDGEVAGEMELSLQRINPNGIYDTAAIVSIGQDGNWGFRDIERGDYIISCRWPENTWFQYYYGDVVTWEEAEIISVSEDVSGLKVDAMMPSFAGPHPDNGIKGGIVFSERSLKGSFVYLTRAPVGSEHYEVVYGTLISEDESFSFHSLPDGEYKLKVEVPGISTTMDWTILIGGGTKDDHYRVEINYDQPSNTMVVEEVERPLGIKTAMDLISFGLHGMSFKHEVDQVKISSLSGQVLYEGVPRNEIDLPSGLVVVQAKTAKSVQSIKLFVRD